MTRAIVMAFHKYTPFGDEFYAPILDFQLQNLKKYENEFDALYLVDSTWNISPDTKTPKNTTIIKVDPSLRYYDAYKKVLPEIKEDLVLFMDNDMVVCKEGIINLTFNLLSEEGLGPDVVSIIDTIGTMQVPLKTGNKFCPYWFATRTELLKKYLNVDWSPDAMPYTETFGLLTEAMLKDGLKAYEMEDDKTYNADKNLGYYHIRSGSTPAVLLAWKHSPDHTKTYYDYLKNQPGSEIMRHMMWYEKMGGDISTILGDLEQLK